MSNEVEITLETCQESNGKIKAIITIEIETDSYLGVAECLKDVCSNLSDGYK